MSLNFSSLIAFDYWFGQPTSFRAQTLITYLSVLALFFLIGIVCKVMAGNSALPGVRRGLFRRWGTWAIVGAVVGWVFVFFRYEYIPFLSRRFWFGFWFIGMIIWAAYVWHYGRRRVERARTTIPVVDPYLPRPKK